MSGNVYRVLRFYPNPASHEHERYEINGVRYSGPSLESSWDFYLAWGDAVQWGTPTPHLLKDYFPYAFVEKITNSNTPLFRGHPIGAVVSNSFTNANGHTAIETRKYRFDQGDPLPIVRRIVRTHANSVVEHLLISPR